jgi:UDP-N-acetylmuramyl pentapeptide phosphotransferase/UDP-N-acetylglucosamine-1-phosphate transferase
LGVALGYALGLLAIVARLVMSGDDWLDAEAARRLAVATAFAFVFLVIGFVDDAAPLGPRGKFAAFTMAAVSAALAVGVARVFPLGAGHAIDVGFAAGLVGSTLWIFTLVNSVNFMDGANGLAMGSAAIGLLGLALVALNAHAPDAAAMGLCGAGALIGFLIWNYPNGKLFAGDSGALFVGALASLASLMAISEAGVSPFVPPMLFFPLLADALLTLAWRARRKRNLLHGHSDHLYQVAIRAKLSHRRVAAFYWLAALASGAVSIAAQRAGGLFPLTAFAALAAGALLVAAMVRAWSVKRGIGEAQ